MGSMYDQDLVLWSEEQARALRAAANEGWNAPIDWEHVAEEIESLGKSDRRNLFPRITDVLPQICFRARRRIGGDDIKSPGEILGCPACADDSGADNRDATNWFVERHDYCSLEEGSEYAMPDKFPWAKRRTRLSDPLSFAE